MTLQIKSNLSQFRIDVQNVWLPKIDERPVKTGDKAPFFSLLGRGNDWKTSLFNEPIVGGGQSLSLLDLTADKPVVVSFYCSCWGRYAEPYLNSLIRLANALEHVGAELVVFSTDSPRALARQGRNLNFILAHDTDQQVAKQFGIYNEDSPIWERVSGISDEAFLPAVYVIDPDRRISYHFVDENFDASIDSDAVVSYVWSLVSTDPEFAAQPIDRRNVYAERFAALWLLGFLVAAGAQFLPF